MVPEFVIVLFTTLIVLISSIKSVPPMPDSVEFISSTVSVVTKVDFVFAVKAIPWPYVAKMDPELVIELPLTFNAD